MPVEQNEILPNIAKRMSLNRFFAVQRDIVNDELESVVPDLIEDALENPTGTYQRTSKSMTYQMTTIDRTTKSIKEDTVEILRFLNKDLMNKLDNIEAGADGGGGLLGGLASLLGTLGLGYAGVRSLFSRLKGGAGAKPPTAKPPNRPGSGPPVRGRGPQFRVSDLPPRVQKQMYEQGRRSSQYISDDLAKRHGLVNQYSQYGQGQKLTRFMITPKQLAVKMLGKVDAVASKLSVPLAAGLETWDGLNEYLQVRASYEAGMLTKDQYANEINRILAKYPARFLGGLAASMMAGYWGQSLFSGKVGKFFGGVVGGALGYTVGSTLSGYAVDLLMGDETIGSVLKKEYDVDLNRTATPEQTKSQYQNQAYNYNSQAFSETLQKMETEKGFKATAQTQYTAGMVGGAPPHAAMAGGFKTVVSPDKLNYDYGKKEGKKLVEINKKAIIIIGNKEVLGQIVDVLYQDPNNQRYIIRYENGDITDTGHRTLKFLDRTSEAPSGSGAYLAARQMAKAAEGAPAGIMGPSYASLAPTTMTDAMEGYRSSPLGFGPLAGAPAGGSGGGGGGSGTSAGGGAVPSASTVSAGPMGFSVSTEPRTATKTGAAQEAVPQRKRKAGELPASIAEVEAYIRESAIARGVDPDIAIKVARSEGLYSSKGISGGFQSDVKVPGYGYEDSWSAFQLLKSHKGKIGGVGHKMMKETGLDPADPQNWRESIDYTMNYVIKNGWNEWYGARKQGIKGKMGVSQGAAPVPVGSSAPGTYEETGTATQEETGTSTATQESSSLTSGFVSPVTGTFQENASNVYGAPRGSYAKGGSKQSGPKTRRHSGSDWRAADGSEAVSPVNGTVIHTGRHSGYGGMIDIMGDDGRVYRLAPHGDMKNFRPGQKINQGDVVGTIAQRHLHFEVIPSEINGRPNPVWQEFKSKLDSGKGGFVATSNQRGTVDPAAALGIQSGQKVSAGQSWRMDQATGTGNKLVDQMTDSATPVPSDPQAVQSIMDNTRAAPDRTVPEAIEEPDTVKEDIQEMKQRQKSFLELQRSSDAGRATTVEPVATLADMSQTQFRPQNSPAIMRQKAAAQGIMMANFGGYNVLDATSLPPSGETGIIA